ncbi:MAG: hypothetical protein L0191_02040 [Acidobacteria bacterium]|nr:hypothetical protein [Acidobacteriota bacterium]
MMTRHVGAMLAVLFWGLIIGLGLLTVCKAEDCGGCRPSPCRRAAEAWARMTYPGNEILLATIRQTIPAEECRGSIYWWQRWLWPDAYPKVKMDFTVYDIGTVYLLIPVSDAAREWVKAHLPDDMPYFGEAIPVEHERRSNLRTVVEAARRDGLVVSERRTR